MDWVSEAADWGESGRDGSTWTLAVVVGSTATVQVAELEMPGGPSFQFGPVAMTYSEPVSV